MCFVHPNFHQSQPFTDLVLVFRVVVSAPHGLLLPPRFTVSVGLLLCAQDIRLPNISGAHSTSPFLSFAFVKGLAAITGPFIAAALHPDRVGERSEPSASGWAGYGFTGALYNLSGLIPLK